MKITLNIPDRMHEALRCIAAHRGLTVTAVVRIALHDYIASLLPNQNEQNRAQKEEATQAARAAREATRAQKEEATQAARAAREATRAQKEEIKARERAKVEQAKATKKFYSIARELLLLRKQVQRAVFSKKNIAKSSVESRLKAWKSCAYSLFGYWEKWAIKDDDFGRTETGILEQANEAVTDCEDSAAVTKVIDDYVGRYIEFAGLDKNDIRIVTAL